jgi:hypothetical protein
MSELERLLEAWYKLNVEQRAELLRAILSHVACWGYGGRQ